MATAQGVQMGIHGLNYITFRSVAFRGISGWTGSILWLMMSRRLVTQGIDRNDRNLDGSKITNKYFPSIFCIKVHYLLSSSLFLKYHWLLFCCFIQPLTCWILMGKCKNSLGFTIPLGHWDGTSNGNPFSLKTRSRLLYTVNIFVTWF